MGVYNPYSGVTSNQSESFNALLKRLQSWREVPIDAIVLALYCLQAFHSNEFQRGFAGHGNISLSAEFTAAQQPAKEILTIQPEEIVTRIRQRIGVMVNTEDTENIPPERTPVHHLALSMHVQGIAWMASMFSLFTQVNISIHVDFHSECQP